MPVHRQKATLAAFWAVVLMLPMVSGIFSLNQAGSIDGWLGIIKTGLSVLGYCLLVGVVGPRLLTKLGVYKSHTSSDEQRNKLWLERSLTLGLLGLGLSVWSGLAA